MTFLVSILTLVGLGVAAGVRSVFQRPWIAAVMLQGMAQVAFVTGPVIVCPSV